MLELIALGGLLAVAIFQFQQVDLDLAQREHQSDLRLRDYVISHDLEYVKSELISLQKANWNTYARHSKQSWTIFWVAAFAVVALGTSLLLRAVAGKKHRPKK